MNQEQADVIIAVIEKDANSTGRLFRGENRACVIGGLLENWRPELRVEMNDLSGFRGEDADLRDAFVRHYGLKRDQIFDLMAVNDDYDSTSRRRPALIRLVQKFVR